MFTDHLLVYSNAMLRALGMVVVSQMGRRMSRYETNGVGLQRLAQRWVWLLGDSQGRWPGAPWAKVLNFPLDCWEAFEEG